MDNPTAATEQTGSTRPSNTGAHRRPSRRWAASSMAALTVATLVAVGCVADPGPTAGATLTAATSTVGVVDGSVVRVSGRGYNPAANIGTRPPLFAQPAGVYVIFACVSDPWRPSQGATGSSRQVIQQFWAVPGQAQFDGQVTGEHERAPAAVGAGARRLHRRHHDHGAGDQRLVLDDGRHR